MIIDDDDTEGRVIRQFFQAVRDYGMAVEGYNRIVSITALDLTSTRPFNFQGGTGSQSGRT